MALGRLLLVLAATAAVCEAEPPLTQEWSLPSTDGMVKTLKDQANGAMTTATDTAESHKGLLDSAKSSLASAKEQAQGHLDSAKEQAKGLADSASQQLDSTKEQAKGLTDRASQNLDSLKESAEQQAAGARKQVQGALKDTTQEWSMPSAKGMTNAIQDQAHETMASAKEGMADAKEQMSEAKAELKGMAGDAKKEASALKEKAAKTAEDYAPMDTMAAAKEEAEEKMNSASETLKSMQVDVQDKFLERGASVGEPRGFVRSNKAPLQDVRGFVFPACMGLVALITVGVAARGAAGRAPAAEGEDEAWAREVNLLYERQPQE